jgi:hypothetical protein
MAQAWAASTAVVMIALTTAAMASAQPVAHAATTCHVGSQYNKLGPTYVESLHVSRTSCATGMNVIRAYNSCRLKAGGRKGYCHTKVFGFSCSEHRSQSPTQFIASARCTKGRAVVTFTYTENTT